jgi:hypothetical protein
VIELMDDDPDIVARMLIYMYNPVYYASEADWNYSHESERGVFSEARRRQALLIPNDRSCYEKIHLDPLAVHAKLHGLSHKYDIPELTKLSGERFPEFVAHVIQLDEDLTVYPEFSEDLVVAIKITYGSEQRTDHTLREATVYLARTFAKSIAWHNLGEIKELKANVEAFHEVFRSVSGFAWDMISLDFEDAKFACDYCGKEFVIAKDREDPTKCACSQRGLCGECTSVSKLECLKCGRKGGCRLIRYKSMLASGIAGRY